MRQKKFISEAIISLVLTLLFLFLDYKISLGIVLGFIFSILNYRLIEYRYQNLDSYNIWVVIGSLICILLLGIPLLISFLLSNIFSYIGVMIGLLIIKVKLIIEAFVKK